MSLLVARRGLLAAGVAAEVPAPSGDYAAEVLADSPHAYWRFEETAGSTAADELENHDGTYVNNPNRDVDGAPETGSAVEFTGSEYVEMTTLGTFGSQMGDGFSVELWAKWGNGTDQAALGTVNDGSGSTLLQVRLNFPGTGSVGGNDPGRVVVTLRDSSGDSCNLESDTAVWNDGEWHHIVGVFDGTRWALYIDGEDRSGDFAADDEPSNFDDFDHPLYVGGNNARGSVNLHTTGAVDEVALYQRMLTPQEIATHNALGRGEEPPEFPDYAPEVTADSPVAYWRLNDTSGPVVDETGNHDGINDGATRGEDALIVTGDAEAAFGFDGATGSVQVPWHADLQTAEWSVEAWARLDGWGESESGRIVSNHHNGEAGWGLWIDSGATLDPAVTLLIRRPDGSAEQLVYRDADITFGRTYHVVGTYDGDTARLFVDGSQVGSIECGYDPNPSTDLRIGRRAFGDREFDGRIDEVALYDYALSPWRVAVHNAVGRGQIPPPEPPPVDPPELLAHETTVESNDTATSITVDVPTAPAGSVLLAFLTKRQDTGDFTPPDQFVPIEGAGGQNMRTSLFAAVATGDEPADYTFTWASGDKCVAAIVALDPSVVADHDLSVFSDDDPFPAPSVEVASNALLLAYYAAALRTFDPPASMSEVYQVATTSGGASAAMLAQEDVFPGETGVRESDLSSSSSGMALSAVLTVEDRPLILDGYVGRNTRGHAIEVDGKTYIGVTTSRGGLIVWEDGILHHVGSTPVSDDHNAPSVIAPTDRPPAVAWTRHNNDSLVRVRVGTAQGDLGSLGSEQTLDAGTSVSYTRLHNRPGSDDLWLATRASGSGSVNHLWRFWTSDDYGDTWDGPTTLLDYPAGSQLYLDVAQDGDVLDCVVHEHPLHSQDGQTLRFLRIDLGTGAITDVEGNGLGNLDGTNLPLGPTDIPLAYEAPAGRLRYENDLSPGTNPEVVFVEWTDGDDDYLYRYLRWDGTGWQDHDIVSAGTNFGDSSTILNQHHVGQTALPKPGGGGVVYLAREDGGMWYVEEWTTSDGGESWTSEEVAVGYGVPYGRVHCPIGATAGPAVVWHKVFHTAANQDFRAALLAPAEE